MAGIVTAPAEEEWASRGPRHWVEGTRSLPSRGSGDDVYGAATVRQWKDTHDRKP
jgi:hypothetical protein